jgi:hypothetical protein
MRALTYAANHISRLPRGTRWTFFMNEEDPATLNILVESDQDAVLIQQLLSLFVHHERGKGFETFKTGSDLLVSLVRPEFYNTDVPNERMD